MQSQILTDAAQRGLIEQKTVTEVAQTQDNPTSNVSAGYSGVVGKQNAYTLLRQLDLLVMQNRKQLSWLWIF